MEDPATKPCEDGTDGRTARSVPSIWYVQSANILWSALLRSTIISKCVEQWRMHCEQFSRWRLPMSVENSSTLRKFKPFIGADGIIPELLGTWSDALQL